jgi:mono/diheme cytochrome c family protein
MRTRLPIGVTIVLATLGLSAQARQAGRPAAPAPTAAQLRATFVRVCGTCHPPERVTATGRTKAQWEESINTMVTTRGAVVAADDYDLVLAYLVREHGPQRAGAPAGTSPRATAAPAAARAGAGQAVPAPPRRTGGAGPDDKHVVDATAAARGRTTYAAACITCHGTQARGTERGVNVLRSLVLLRDRYGSTLGPFLQRGHPTQSGPPSTAFTRAQVQDLSHFLHERLNDTLRGSPVFTVQNVLTGDRAAGETYFNGAGGCRTCHSPTGDLAGYGKRYDAAAIQQRFLFPRPPTRGPRGGAAAPAGKPVTVTVTTAGGETATGVLVHLDDFNVSLRDADGTHRTWKRTGGLTVVKHDPYAAHVERLDTYTDKQMHDLTAYLESLK